MAINANIKKENISPINNLILHLEETETNIKVKPNRKEEIIKFSVEIF